MPITFGCSCGRSYRVSDEYAGKRTKCPACGTKLVVPQPAEVCAEPQVVEPEQPEATYGLQKELEPDRPPQVAHPEEPESEPEPPEPACLPAAQHSKHSVPQEAAVGSGREWLASQFAAREWAYWTLLIALFPLVLSLLISSDDTIGVRLDRTMEHASPEAHRYFSQWEELPTEEATNKLLDALPNGRIEGAHLPRRTFIHYLYALMATGAFLGIGLFFLPTESGNAVPLLLTGVFTGTVGILLLFLVQYLADLTQRYGVISGNPIIMIVFSIAWAIGYSYRAASDPNMSFLGSLLGYTFGVGLCEEVCKALPLIFYFRTSASVSWRDARAWGFASGVGFGIAEGIMYSSDYYNGIHFGGIYAVRFISCVTLHAIWSAAVAMFIYKHRAMIQGDLRWFAYVPCVIFLVSVPMLLHGLYDTALEKDMEILALLTALVSFAWLFWRTEVARREEEPETIADAAHAG